MVSPQNNLENPRTCVQTRRARIRAVNSRTASGRTVEPSQTSFAIADLYISSNRTLHIAHEPIGTVRYQSRSHSPSGVRPEPFVAGLSSVPKRTAARKASESESDHAGLLTEPTTPTRWVTTTRERDRTGAGGRQTRTDRCVQASGGPSADPSRRELRRGRVATYIPGCTKLQFPLPLPGSPLQPSVARAARARCHAHRTDVYIGKVALRQRHQHMYLERAKARSRQGEQDARCS
ncbi:hypothetical protein K466DRAFT_279938 [Polyporus arcularius HHB13444]|uniref:Uncharacterized protein n=1 Tax=Polyporus arcularius HHB13444 TaxID=1314778 RepID=A0A5C3P028_9APHY|nr:hypothetical protein K466DRAFT_279938 [Polyporus arcularius HHB13444]